ncbi:MraY family glycosyltransferase [Dokdonella sp. MW10]|uniref:MraY family glycosyltransferase n=1 Tax=Dokdonella sp. MW10 TaxID=2992926 RepID=UPI003F821254
MEAWSIAAWGIVALCVLAASAGVTAWSLAYARRRNLLDQPGQRRSHTMPTPRGGGIGIVAGVLVASLLVLVASHGVDVPALLAISVATLLVAAVGWIDDHRGLGARPRLLAHLAAAIVLLVATPLAGLVVAGSALWIALSVMLVVAIAWSVNLHNFMDGIDGLLATQALFVFTVLAALCAMAGRVVEAERIGLFAAATLGFLPFNFPRARIFMGDVGSGVLGLLVAVAIGWQMLAPPVAVASGLVACSVFVVDATATLLWRMVNGRRWYSAHREHLYQWLVRGGRSHRRVTGMYMAWNLVVVVPVLAWMNHGLAMPATNAPVTASSYTGLGVEGLVVAYGLATLAWLIGKRHCIRAARHRLPRS